MQTRAFYQACKGLRNILNRIALRGFFIQPPTFIIFGKFIFIILSSLSIIPVEHRAQIVRDKAPIFQYKDGFDSVLQRGWRRKLCRTHLAGRL